MSTPVIDFKGITKDFKGDFWQKITRAVDDVSFQVEQGDVFGLIGPNGAGKTTIIKMLMGLLKPTKGVALINGCSATDSEAKRAVGYLPEHAYYYDFLYGEELIDFYGRLFGFSRSHRQKRIDELLEVVGLADRRGIRLRHYSKGMLQRIGIAQALVNDPSVVIFDEPMSGLDPIGRKEVRDIILRLAESGKTILFSSHILSDVEEICEKVAILINGNLRACGSISDLVHPRVKSVEISFLGTREDSLRDAWKGRVSKRISGDQTILVSKEPDLTPDMIQWGQEKNLTLLSVRSHKESLEDIFLQQVRA